MKGIGMCCYGFFLSLSLSCSIRNFPCRIGTVFRLVFFSPFLSFRFFSLSNWLSSAAKKVFILYSEKAFVSIVSLSNRVVKRLVTLVGGPPFAGKNNDDGVFNRIA